MSLAVGSANSISVRVSAYGTLAPVVRQLAANSSCWPGLNVRDLPRAGADGALHALGRVVHRHDGVVVVRQGLVEDHVGLVERELHGEVVDLLDAGWR